MSRDKLDLRRHGVSEGTFSLFLSADSNVLDVLTYRPLANRWEREEAGQKKLAQEGDIGAAGDESNNVSSVLSAGGFVEGSG